jgi:sugar phosphate isomerase/epimerase
MRRAYHGPNLVFERGPMMDMRQRSGMSRRRFLSLAAGAAAMAGSRRALAASQHIPTGIQLYTVGADFAKDPAGTLKKLAEIGYKEVETAGFANLTAAQLRDLLKETGLHAPSAHLRFGVDDTGKLLADAKALGAEYAVSSVLLPPAPQAGAGSRKNINQLQADDFKAIAALANEIARNAKAAGLQYAYHNHNFEFRDLGGGQTGYEILLRETDPALVKFEADTGWMKVAGADPVAFLTKYPERYVMLHIKDFKDISAPVTIHGGGNEPMPTELGRGSIDLKAIVDAGKRAGVKHMFVEQEPPFKDMTPMEAAAVDYACLHGLLEGK